jgi:hypothetical protein
MKRHRYPTSKRLYRGEHTKERELRKFEREYGKEKAKKVYGATVGKVYREKYGHPYRGGSHPAGPKGAEYPRKRYRNF